MNLQHRATTVLLALVVMAVAANEAAAFPPADATAVYTGSATDPKHDDKQIIDELHHAVCWVNCSASANGAGWVLDAKRKLVLTSRRVIHNAKHVLVYFPVKRLGKWETDEGYYLKTAKAYSATIIASDYWNDTALLQLDDLPTTAKALKFAPASAARGSRLHVLSAKTRGGTALWTQNSGLARGTGLGPVTNPWKPLILVATMFSTRHSLGEPIVNEQGHVVGVVEGATTTEVDGKPLATGGTAIRAFDCRQVRHWLKPIVALVDPQTATDYYERGRLHVEENRYPQAIADLSTALLRDPTLTKAHLQRGWAYANSGKYQLAIPDFDKAVQSNSKDDNALYGRAIVYYRLKRTADALAGFNAAIALNSRNWRYYNWRGIIHFDASRYRDALADFSTAATLPGADDVVFRNKGSAAMNLRSYATAAVAYHQANRINPRIASSHNREGVCYFHLKLYAKAVAKFQDAIKLNGTYALYHENLGNSLQELGKHKEAVEAYSQAVRHSTYTASTLHYNRGVSRMALKQTADAVIDFTAAVTKNSKYAAAYYQRARAYVALGKTLLAEADLKTAQSLDKARYGSLTMANLGSAPVVKPTISTMTGGGTGSSKIAGRWHFRQKLNGKDTEIDLTFQGDGSYSSKITIFDENGRGTPVTEAGTYTTKAGNLALNPKGGKSVSRSFGFESTKKMWIYFAESRVELHFDRK